MTTATLTSKGQLTVPKEIREFLKIDTGDTIEFVIDPKTNSVTISKKGKLCPTCNGSTILESHDLPCFVCDASGYINLDNGIIPYIMMGISNRKYKINKTITNQKTDSNNSLQFNIMPKIELFSQEYSRELLDSIQDDLQIMIIEEFAPKTVSSDDFFMIPTDAILIEILHLLTTKKAKDKVTSWFRAERSSFNKN
ncbi:AbrB/MazE/SpoVT family DNA-binding domain-containing protein [Lysinibacillus fusiformis]|uniref:AbrB/MazE/SpoVT family DNA-binding domain-containing protein n=1 Tax=Lysinibacillus fusiformis TaxID=28031 RepID=UPI0021BF1D79|nr:AbrB/MazE/SpoVT family DNA-binding domain-containing protein [Lysinibacillus fusiformis]UXJ71296.1 AbrB/MazE/SpoVT family DNA-binding domain-containing protein [Lysinibacillus fusiformis]